MISNLPEDQQHKHPNGSGWVANTARVSASVFVGPHADMRSRRQNVTKESLTSELVAYLLRAFRFSSERVSES